MLSRGLLRVLCVWTRVELRGFLCGGIGGGGVLGSLELFVLGGSGGWVGKYRVSEYTVGWKREGRGLDWGEEWGERG